MLNEFQKLPKPFKILPKWPNFCQIWSHCDTHTQQGVGDASVERVFYASEKKKKSFIEIRPCAFEGIF